MIGKITTLLLSILFTMQYSFAEDLMINPGTRVTLTLPNSVSSESIEHDGTITAMVSKDVIVNQKVIFQKGALAGINVENIRKRSIFGRSGKIVLNGGYVEDVNKQRHPLNFSYETEGKSRRAFSIAYTVVSLPLVLFIVGLVTLPIAISIKGKEATMQGGQLFDTFTTTAKTVSLPSS